MWFDGNDETNESLPVPAGETQSITRAELRGALGALLKKRPGVPLHSFTDSELVYLGLKVKSEKCKQHEWVGPKRLLSHVDLQSELWDQGLLLV